MKLPPILSIIWARRAVFAVPVVGALIGSSIAMAVTPPRYMASARVVLNYIKPDAETGIVVNSKMVETYEKTQIDFLREPEVSALAAEAMGWLDLPEMQEAYALRDPQDTRDMATWAAARLMGGISAVMVEDSNILEVRYTAASPEMATAMVGAIRDAYLQASTNQLRRSAEERANANALRLRESNKRLAELEAQKTRVERATGLILDASRRELDAAKLANLASARPRAPVVDPGQGKPSVQANNLAAVDAAIASRAGGLGPNHPQYQAMLRQREQAKAMAEQAGQRENAFSSFFQSQARAEAALFEALKAKVLSQRPDALQLKLLQDQIDREREIATSLAESTAEERQGSTGEQSGLIPIGEPSEARESIRSNSTLIISTAVAMGVLYGALLALLVEFLARQVRSAEALQAAASAPVLGVVPRNRRRGPPRRGRWPKPRRLPAGRAAAVQA